MAKKKKESLEQRLRKAAEKEKKAEGPALKAPSRVAEERAAVGGVKLRRPARLSQEPVVKTETPFGPLNWWLLAGGVILAAIGFVFLYLGDTIISTTLLVIGYCVVIPVALLISPKVFRRKPAEAGEAASKGETKEEREL